MPPVLSVSGVGKRYATYPSTLHRALSWFGASVVPSAEFWANRDISFAVEAGQGLALIGTNGAGKSTLLKMITGTVRPTEGRIDIIGRISAILELGIGFNPELTGRQNVRQAGGLMGFSGEEIAGLMPEIEAFAELGPYFDQPLRTYSSGMQARLAFSLATARRPDILIVDEVLSVGDSYFQHKSFDRIRAFKEQGCTILLVTHNLGDVRALCDRVILLEKGRILKDGAPDEVVDYYNAMIAERDNQRLDIEQSRHESGWLRTRSGSREATVKTVSLLDDAGAPVASALVGQKLVIRTEIEVGAPVRQIVVGLMLRDRTGHIVWGSNTWHTDQAIRAPEPDSRYRSDYAFHCTLGPGSYGLSVALTSGETHIAENFEWQENALVFDVVNVDRPVFLGTNALDGVFTIDRV